MVGLGGIFVEVLKDVSFRICPISEADANEMVSELKAAALLDDLHQQSEAQGGLAGRGRSALIRATRRTLGI